MPKLPKKVIEKRIVDMQDGEKCYAVPWALFVGPDEEVYLQGNFSVSDSAGGTAQMLIQKTADCILVNLSKCTPRSWNVQPVKEGDIYVDVLKW